MIDTGREPLLTVTVLPAAMVLLAVSMSAGKASAYPGLNKTLSAHPPYTCKTNVYVDSLNGDDAASGTEEHPWRTIQNAGNGQNVPVPGECVNVLPGTYRLTNTLVLGSGGKSGGFDDYVIYRSRKPQAAHLIAAAPISDMVAIWAPNIVIDGFEIDGNKYLANSNGINACNGGNPQVHHVLMINNLIHDVGGAGITACKGDFLWIWYNEVYNTSALDTWQVSAIDLWEPAVVPPGNYATNPQYKDSFSIQISYNKVYHNGESAKIPAPHSDGNGIIVDTTLGSSTCPTCGTVYPGKILVLGNAVFKNGGCGVNVFLSTNVTVAENTAYDNHQDSLIPYTVRGELSNGGSTDITWVNNLAFAVKGDGILANNGAIVTETVGSFPDSAIWQNNIAFGGPVVSDKNSNVDAKSNLIGVNPELKDPAHSNFLPKVHSPAIDAGRPETYIPVKKPNIGAY